MKSNGAANMILVDERGNRRMTSLGYDDERILKMATHEEQRCGKYDVG